MKRKFIVLGLCTLMACGCGKTIPTLENGEEAVVTFENGEKISINDLYNNVKNNYALSSLINMIDKKILESKYSDLIDEANKYADSLIKSYEETYGDQLLSLIQYQYGYQTIDAFKDYVYLNYFQNEAIEDYAKAQITDKEIQKYYDEKVYGDILVNHILITSKASDDATDEEKKAAEDEAKNKVNEIIEELKKSDNVKETFTKLASENSEDESTKNEGGSLGYINDGTLSSKYDELLKAATELKNGEFSTTVITTELGYHVIYREDSKEKASLDEVKDSIIEKLANELLSNDGTISVKALQNMRKEAGVDIIDSELQNQYAKYIQAALTQSSSNN